MDEMTKAREIVANLEAFIAESKQMGAWPPEGRQGEERMVQLIASALRDAKEEEREACALLMEYEPDDGDIGREFARRRAQAIRARSTT